MGGFWQCKGLEPGEKENNWWKEDRVGEKEIRLSQHPCHPDHHPTLSSPSYLQYLGAVSPGLVGARSVKRKSPSSLVCPLMNFNCPLAPTSGTKTSLPSVTT